MTTKQMFADVPDRRRALMGRIKGANTKPELIVRRVLHGMGRRFRLHRRDLPGRPDIALPRLRIAIFVHGCFWHRHPGCRGTTTPKTRTEFWLAKFEANLLRDSTVQAALTAAGWKVVVIWECETRDVAKLEARLLHELGTRPV